MISIDIPGRKKYDIGFLVLDYNGTIAVDGKIKEELKPLLCSLSEMVSIKVLTADTYGSVKRECEGLPVEVMTFPREGAALFKEKIVKALGEGVCAVGNGYNDILMLDASELSIAVIEEEGMCAELFLHAKVVVRSAEGALRLLTDTDRLKATLRS